MVQPILVSALLFALPLSARLARRRVTRGEWLWAVVLTVALAVFVVLAKTRPGDYEASLPLSALVAVICTAAVSACVIVATRTMGWKRAVLLALAVGVLFGVVAVLTKLMMHVLIHEGVRALLITPVPYLPRTDRQSSRRFCSSRRSMRARCRRRCRRCWYSSPSSPCYSARSCSGRTSTSVDLDAVLITISTVAMAAATIALGRDEGAYEEQLEAAVAQRPA